MDANTTILVAVSDLMFGSRVHENVLALGVRLATADTTDEAMSRLDPAPALLVVDLQGIGIDAPRVIADAKAKGVAVVAFGRHTEAEALRSAREAGADSAVVRSTFVEDMPTLLRKYLQQDQP